MLSTARRDPAAARQLTWARRLHLVGPMFCGVGLEVLAAQCTWRMVAACHAVSQTVRHSACEPTADQKTPYLRIPSHRPWELRRACCTCTPAHRPCCTGQWRWRCSACWLRSQRSPRGPRRSRPTRAASPPPRASSGGCAGRERPPSPPAPPLLVAEGPAGGGGGSDDRHALVLAAAIAISYAIACC